MVNDPATRSLYPSVQSCCYRVSPAETVALAHQQAFCLTKHHVDCPVFKQTQPTTLPSNLRGEPVSVNGNGQPVNVAWFVGVLFVLLAAGSVFWFGNGLAANGSADTPAPPLAVVPTETATAVRATAIPATATSTTTATATPTATAETTPTPTVTPSPQATTTQTATPTVTPIQFPWLITDETELSLRLGPGLGYPLLTTLAESGLMLEVTGSSENGRWWRVCCWQEAEGWLLADPLIDETAVAAISVVATPPLPRAIVQAEPLNLRQGPSTDFAIVSVAALDDSFEIVGRSADGEWLELCCIEAQNVWSIREALFVIGLETAVPVITD